jgi:hypothetical protein
MPMLVVKQFHYISKEESQMVLESIISKAQSIVLLMLMQVCEFQKRAALNAKL